ncbi:hypothetical protein [Streptomyces sp. NPDC002402]
MRSPTIRPRRGPRKQQLVAVAARAEAGVVLRGAPVVMDVICIDRAGWSSAPAARASRSLRGRFPYRGPFPVPGLRV